MRLPKSIGLGRALRFALWIAVTILALNAGRMLYMGFRPARARAASPQAFTILRTESVFDQAGKLLGTNHYVEAVRSDGSRMRQASTSFAQSRTIWFSNGNYVRTNDITGKKSSYPKHDPDNRVTSCPDQRLLSSGWVNGGEDMVGAYRAVRMVHSGSLNMTIWYGLDLGCSILQQHYQHENGTTDQNLEAVVVGEPDAALFEASPTFKEVPPSQLVCSADEPTCATLPDSERRDMNYHNARKKAGLE